MFSSKYKCGQSNDMQKHVDASINLLNNVLARRKNLFR